MKIIVFLAGLALASSALADIHDPPSNDYGPTRKLGRGFANFFLAPAEIPVTIATVNTNEGNSAAAGYGVVRGRWTFGDATRRWLARNSALAGAGLSAKLLSVTAKRYSMDPCRLRGVPA